MEELERMAKDGGGDQVRDGSWEMGAGARSGRRERGTYAHWVGPSKSAKGR